jgi:hypothetical protein
VSTEATADGGAGVSLDGVYSNVRCLLLPHAGEPGYAALLQRLQRFAQEELARHWKRQRTMAGNGTCDPVEGEGGAGGRIVGAYQESDRDE